MSQASEKSVTQWIAGLKAGDEEAARRLWERYFQKLVGLARSKLGDTPRRAADEEDVALIAFNSFCLGAEKGRFPRLDDRDDLWQILLDLTEKKAIDQKRYDGRQMRDWRRTVGESKLQSPHGSSDSRRGLDRLPLFEPTPEFAAQLAEEFQCRLDALNDELLCRVALLKMENYTNQEIAEKLNCVPRTIDRKLRGIRDIWSQENRE